MEWRNHFPAGPEAVGNIRRFPVDRPIDVAEFDRLSVELVSKGEKASLVEQERWLEAQGPISSELLHYLEQHRTNYEAFIFFGYLYATCYFGLPLVKEKAFLAPLAHNEWTIHLKMWDRFFTEPQGFIFQTEEEKEFLQHRFSDLKLTGLVAGVGIDLPPAPDVTAFRKKY